MELKFEKDCTGRLKYHTASETSTYIKNMKLRGIEHIDCLIAFHERGLNMMNFDVAVMRRQQCGFDDSFELKS